MAWARLESLALQPYQVDPAHLCAHRTTERLTHPRGDQAPGPVVALGRGATDGRSQRSQLFGREQRRRTMAVCVAPVVHALRAFGVVALGDLADPIAGIAGTLSNLLGEMAAC